MTQDEIIRMARESGLGWVARKRLERFAALVAAHEKKFWMEQIDVECNEAILAEREACAKECDYWADQAEARGYTCKGETHVDGFGNGAAACAAAIRARCSDAS